MNVNHDALRVHRSVMKLYGTEPPRPRVEPEGCKCRVSVPDRCYLSRRMCKRCGLEVRS